jgi:uncharacterized phage-associated protein
MKPDIETIVQSLNYLARKFDGNTLNKMKAYKLLWLAERYHLRQYGRTITGDEYYAAPHGLIPTTGKDILDGNKYHQKRNEVFIASEYDYTSIKDVNIDVFSDSDIEVLNLIVNQFGKYNQYELSDISHEFPEWKKYEKEIKASGKKSYRIDFEDFFLNHDEESKLFIDDEAYLLESKELFAFYY